jgi:hypothetical protein
MVKFIKGSRSTEFVPGGSLPGMFLLEGERAEKVLRRNLL